MQKTPTIILIISVFIEKNSFSKWSWRFSKLFFYHVINHAFIGVHLNFCVKYVSFMH